MGSPVLPTHWSLRGLLGGADGASVDRLLGRLEPSVFAIESARETLSADLSPDASFALVCQYEEMSQLASRLGAYACLWYAEDTRNNGRARTQSARALQDERAVGAHQIGGVAALRWLRQPCCEDCARNRPMNQRRTQCKHRECEHVG